MSASLDGLGPDRIETVSERLETARRGSVNELGELLEACRAYLLLVATKDLSPNLRAKGVLPIWSKRPFWPLTRVSGNSEGKPKRSFWLGCARSWRDGFPNSAAAISGTAKRHVVRESPPRSHPTRAAEAFRVADHSPSPSWAAIEREEAQAVADALRRLPPDYVRVIVLVHWEHRTFNQAAEEMDRSVEAVRRLWTRAVERLAASSQAKHER